MRENLHFYIGGQWVDPVEPRTLDVIDPATERVTGRISIGSSADVDRAVAAASAAGPTWAETLGRVRLAALERILAEFEKRVGDLATAITEEMGAPSWLAERFQAPLGLGHFKSAIRILKEFSFEEDRGTTRIVMEPIGVSGFITPWNWPIHQICAKVAPALATGCTVVLKPSEIAPFSGRIFAEIIDAADLPAGSRMGPVISEPQWEKVQRLIASGIEQGATLVTGGPGKPEGLERGYYVRPTVFRDVSNDMEIARDEIFGPVLCMIGYDDEDEAIAIGNDTDYGLGGFVHSRDLDRARRVAARIRAGYISINDAGLDLNAPFGGYKQSGNGREFGDHAFLEFLELKSVLGYSAT